VSETWAQKNTALIFWHMMLRLGGLVASNYSVNNSAGPTRLGLAWKVIISAVSTAPITSKIY
jgi:hypothetical protein